MPASTITPSAYPLVFTELVVFYRDVPPLAMPGGLTQLPPPGTSFARVLAKGIAYSHVRKRLIVSLVQQGTGTKTGVLKEINIHTGVREWFATALQLQASVESKIAIVPTTGPGGFTSGNLYVGSGPTSGTGNQIAKVSPNGTMSSELWAITWTGSAYTQQLIGVVRDRWTTEGVNTQGTELEQSCFADLAPTVPTGWNSWTEISSGGSAFTTDQHVAAATQGDTVCVAARSNGGNYTAGVIYVNRYTISTGLWSGWQPLANIPTGVGTTVLAPAIAMQDTNQVHVFAVEQSTNKLYQNWGGLSGSSWFEVSSMTTTQSPAAALINGAVTVCVHSNVTGGQRICELRPTGEPPWGPVINLPEADQSDYAPAIAQFQNELWVFTLASTKVYARARTASGQWTEKGEIPGGGSSSVSVGAAGTPALVQAQLPHSKQMLLFARGVPNNYHYINVASETGTWSGWSTIDTVGTTDKPDAACVTDSSSPQLYLFARGIGDQRVYWRRTAVAT